MTARKRAMAKTDIERHVDAAAALIGLNIAAEYRAGVVLFFGIAAAQAELVMGLPLGVEDEPAAIFVPVPAEPA